MGTVGALVPGGFAERWRGRAGEALPRGWASGEAMAGTDGVTNASRGQGDWVKREGHAAEPCLVPGG